jgi:hypothetical protein
MYTDVAGVLLTTMENVDRSSYKVITINKPDIRAPVCGLCKSIKSIDYGLCTQYWKVKFKLRCIHGRSTTACTIYLGLYTAGCLPGM